MQDEITYKFCSGEIPHHTPFFPTELSTMGLNVTTYIPEMFVDICKFYIENYSQ